MQGRDEKATRMASVRGRFSLPDQNISNVDRASTDRKMLHLLLRPLCEVNCILDGSKSDKGRPAVGSGINTMKESEIFAASHPKRAMDVCRTHLTEMQSLRPASSISSGLSCTKRVV